MRQQKRAIQQRRKAEEEAYLESLKKSKRDDMSAYENKAEDYKKMMEDL